jgi:hypothetical protein
MMVPPSRFERLTFSLGGNCSIHLSYGGRPDCNNNSGECFFKSRSFVKLISHCLVAMNPFDLDLKRSLVL